MSKTKTHEQIIEGLKKDLTRTYRLDFDRVGSSVMKVARASGLKAAIDRLDAAMRQADDEVKLSAAGDKGPTRRRKRTHGPQP